MLILLAAFLVASVQFNDITSSSGITFKHALSPEKKYIAESMSGGVALFDYDNDGYLDIFFVNSLTVELLKANKKTRSVLYRNNHDGTFSDVTDKARVGDVGWGMGCAVGDFNNDGFDDLYVTSIGPDHLFKNNGAYHHEPEQAPAPSGKISLALALSKVDAVVNAAGMSLLAAPPQGNEIPPIAFEGFPLDQALLIERFAAEWTTTGAMFR